MDILAYIDRIEDLYGNVLPRRKPPRPIADQYQDYKQVQEYFEPRTQMYIEKEMGFDEGGLATPKRGLVDGPGSYGGKVFEPKLDIFEDIVLKFNQGSEYKSVKDVLKEYTKRTKDPFTKKMVNKGLTKGSKASELIKPIISLLETPEDKVNRVFTEALSTDTPVDISVVDKAKVKVASRASVWRANIADKTNLDQAFVNRILNKNPDYIKNKKLFDYLGQSQLLLTDLKDLPLKDQLTYAGEALKGRPRYTGISKSGKTKIMRDPAHKVMEFALRNFIANEGKGAVKFFDKNGKPIKYKTGLKIPYRNSIISYKGKKHTVADLRKPGYMQEFFPNVYDNQIKVNKILNQEVDNPFKKGKKINFGDLMTEIQVRGYGWSPKAGSIDILHGPDGVKGDPFNNLSFGTKKLNYQLEDINKLYRFGKIDNATRLKLLDAATGNLKGLQGDDLLTAIVKQQTKLASQIQKGKTFGTTRQETKKLIKKLDIKPKVPVPGGVTLGTTFSNVTPEMLDFRKLPGDVRNFADIAVKYGAKSPALLNALKKAKAAGKWTGAALATEPLFAAPFVGYQYLAGDTPERLWGDATLGLFGQTGEEEIRKATGERGYATQQLNEYGSQLEGIISAYNALNDENDPRGEQRQMFENLHNNIRNKYNTAYNMFVDDTGQFNKDLYNQALNNYTAGIVQIDKFKKQLAGEREEDRIKTAEKYILPEGYDPLNPITDDVLRNIKGYAGGGLASLTRTVAPPRGPQYRGLDYLKYYGR